MAAQAGPRSHYDTVMGYTPKTGWVGLTAADIAVLRFLYGADAARTDRGQRPGIETVLGDEATGQRPATEQTIPPARIAAPPPEFDRGAEVMTVPNQGYGFTATVRGDDLEISYFLVGTGSTTEKIKLYGNDQPTIFQGFHLDKTSRTIKFYEHTLQEGRLLHKQQVVAVAMDPNGPSCGRRVSRRFSPIGHPSTLLSALSSILSSPLCQARPGRYWTGSAMSLTATASAPRSAPGNTLRPATYSRAW